MIDLHALANTPGAGKAAEALKAAGLWQISKEEIDALPRWDVTVDLSISLVHTISVAASTPEAAERLARKFDDWDVDGTVHDVAVLSVVPDPSPIFDPQIVEGEE